jgi:NAD(P)-dependent dehydrogenase (short-subunit alcohol dehydrogenase family)
VTGVTVDGTALDLSGTVAVVTGAAGGIGRSVAVALAACGADLALCDRDADGLAATAALAAVAGVGGGPAARAGDAATPALCHVLDVRDPEAVTRFLEETRTRFVRVDVLVNNAGGGFHAPFLGVSPHGQTALVDENFTSVTHFVRGCVPLMTKGGSIVNITSVEVFRAAPGFGIYGAMKAAVEHLSRTLALELAPRGIRVNCVAPDAIPTPGDAALAETADPGGREAYGRKVPLGWGAPDDCAGPVLFLASVLSRFVTGTTVRVDGGSSAASGWTRRDDGTYAP